MGIAGLGSREIPRTVVRAHSLRKGTSPPELRTSQHACNGPAVLRHPLHKAAPQPIEAWSLLGFFRVQSIKTPVFVRNQPRASTKREVGPHPLHHNKNTIAKAHQVYDMNKDPGDPSQKS